MHTLGPDFRFRTSFYLDGEHNLYLQGSGDPFLVSEEVRDIVAELHSRGIGEIRDIYIDTSLFELREETPGRGASVNPYDSPVTASGVNFNTVSIMVDEEGRVHSGEAQTPALPIMQELGRGLPAGGHRLNICPRDCTGSERAARHTAELFRALLGEAGIAGGGSWGIRAVPADAKLVYRHANSRTMVEVIAQVLEYSNNYIANLVFLACGVERYGHPATWDKARRAVSGTLRNLLGPDAAEIILDDGSGLSRRNRASARAMLRVLEAFREHRELLPRREGGRIKSGTLRGVYNYAGYLADGQPFVIMLNQERNTRDILARRLQKIAAALPQEEKDAAAQHPED